MDDVWKNNLLVPGIIGENCKYHDLKEYIEDLQPNIEKHLLLTKDEVAKKSKTDTETLRNKMNTATMMIRESIKKYSERYDEGFDKI